MSINKSSISLFALIAVAFSIVFLCACSKTNTQANSKDILTPSERLWLHNHPNLRIAPDPLFPPIEYFDSDNMFQGLASEYISEIERVLNYKFLIIRPKNWEEMIEKLKSKEYDLTTAADNDSSRDSFLVFTNPWIKIPNVIITQNHLDLDLSLESLDGWKVAVTKGYVLESIIRNNYPKIKIVSVDNDEVALSQVSLGNLQATITNLAVSSFIISKQGITNLKANGSINRDDKLCIAIRNDYPILKNIVEKAMKAIPESKFQAMKLKWINFSESPKSIWAWEYIKISVVGIGLVVLGLFMVIAWNWALKKKVQSKTKELELELSAREKAESEITMLNTKLEIRVEERTAELKSLLEVLENEIEERKQTEQVLKMTQDELTIALECEKELNNLKTRFVSMVSHEYRTPLTVILSSASLLEFYFASGDKANFEKHSQRIQRSVKTMTALLNDALFIGKTDAVGLQLKLESIRFKDFIEIIIEDVKRQDTASHTITLNYSVNDEFIEADSDILTHILINLLSNALKYSPARSEVILNVNQDQNRLMFEVIDYGIGIPSTEQKHLFTPFHRFTNVNNIEGTGLGMAIVKRCADILDAEIAIESELNKGTTIKLVVPIISK